VQQKYRPITKRWSALTHEYHIDLVVCISAAQRRGLLAENEAKRQGKLDNDLADGFRIAGLGLTPKLYGWRLNKSMRYTWIHAINEPRNFSKEENKAKATANAFGAPDVLRTCHFATTIVNSVLAS
jgi:hypothetical protein